MSIHAEWSQPSYTTGQTIAAIIVREAKSTKVVNPAVPIVDKSPTPRTWTISSKGLSITAKA